MAVKIKGNVAPAILITGKFQDYTRNELLSLINNCEAVAYNTPNKHIDFLLVGDKPGKTKLDFSKQYNVHHIKQDEIKDVLKDKESLDRFIESLGIILSFDDNIDANNLKVIT